MQREQHRDEEGFAAREASTRSHNPIADGFTASRTIEDNSSAVEDPNKEVVLITRPITKADYDYIVRVIDKWWGGPTSALAHPMFFYELGESAMVVEIEGRLVGFLFGFVAPGGPTGYVHLVGIDPGYRRKQVASSLYRAFEENCRQASCVELKAVTTLGNEGSMRFHEALGWSVEQVNDYAGPGRDRVVFRKRLQP